MPVYTYGCRDEKCGNLWDAYTHSHRDPLPLCSECGGESEKVWSLGNQHIGASAFPFITKHLTGKPILVKSESHLRSLCKQHKVVHRPDAGWVTKEYVGYDWATDKQVYKESSGVGLKGCWV